VDVGERILYVARVRGFSQTDLAQKLGIKPASVSAWGKEDKRPSGKRLAEIATILDVSVDYLLTGNRDLLYFDAAPLPNIPGDIGDDDYLIFPPAPPVTPKDDEDDDLRLFLPAQTTPNKPQPSAAPSNVPVDDRDSVIAEMAETIRSQRETIRDLSASVRDLSESVKNLSAERTDMKKTVRRDSRVVDIDKSLVGV